MNNCVSDAQKRVYNQVVGGSSLIKGLLTPACEAASLHKRHKDKQRNMTMTEKPRMVQIIVYLYLFPENIGEGMQAGERAIKEPDNKI
jgi:hypothetical protein